MHSSYVRKSKYSMLLEGVKKSFEREDREKEKEKGENKGIVDEFVEKSESVALFEVYDKLNEIVKAVPEIPEMTGSYLQNSGVRNFESWMKKMNKKAKHVSI